MSNSGQWDHAQVIEEAKTIEEAAQHGDSSKAFRDEDDRITRSSRDPEVRRANAAAVTAQLERDGYLPVCGFDLAAAANGRYRAPGCGDKMGSVSNILTNSPSESIERAIYSREQNAGNLQFGDIRPSMPKEQHVEAPKAPDVIRAKIDAKGEGKSELDHMKALAEEMRKLNEANQQLRKELEALKAGKQPVDTAHDAKADAAGKNHSQEINKQVEESKAAEQALSRTLLKEMVGKLDLSVAAKRIDKSDGDKQPEVTANVAVTANKDGSMHIAGEPYGTIDLDAKAKLKVEQDGSILATDSKGTTYHFLSKPDAHAMLLETTDKDNNILRKYAPNNEKLISESITRNADGGYTSSKQFNKNEVPYAEYFHGQQLTNPLNTNRNDWITATSATYGKDNLLQSETVDYGKSGYKEAGEIRKVKEIFHYDHGKIADKGLYAEHFYDNGYKFCELSSGQTYIQRRVVDHDVDPVKYDDQAAKNGSVKYHGNDWALSNKQLRPGIHILRTQRDLPESYWNWSDEGELER
ncbi:hypothetical protein BH10CYA1_BH10CYA1_46910 [soil metagenome]